MFKGFCYACQTRLCKKTYIPLNGNKKHVYKYKSSFLVLFSIKTRFSPWMKTHRGPPHPVTTEAIDLRFIVFVELKLFKEYQPPPKIRIGGSTIVHLRLVKLQIKMEFISGYNCWPCFFQLLGQKMWFLYMVWLCFVHKIWCVHKMYRHNSYLDKGK